jgi:acyl dehydratase
VTTELNTRALSADFDAPIDDRFFEDYQIGAKYSYGAIAVSEAEILEFARKFDTQSIHIDPVAAAQGPFGGIIASGWHTTAIMMRLLADHYVSANASLASPGIDELRWTAPVRPGDELSLTVTVANARRSNSKPDRGMVHTAVQLFNQRNEVVLTLTAMNFIRCRQVS